MRVIVIKIISIAFILLFTFKGCTATNNNEAGLYYDDMITAFEQEGHYFIDNANRYVIMECWAEDFSELYWSFVDLTEFKTIENKVYNFKEVGSYVYTLGCCGYMKFNYETGEYQKEEDMEVYSAEDQAIFEEVESTRYIADEIRTQQDYHKRQ